jgi:tRNA-2-methylthio-N6-dimethylallyladenosine synthase
VDESLIAAHRDLPQLMPCLHLPVQSGSDRILAAMKRRHTRAHYLAIVERLRDARPDLAFTSDFIVGFPGESEEDFRETVTLVDHIGFAGAFSFKYSPRPGTPAATMGDQIPDEIKVERLARLQVVIDRHQAEFNARSLGMTLPILLERPGRHPGQLVGRSPYLQPVQVMAPAEMIGEIVAVRITEIGPNSLFGVLDEPASAARPRQAALAAAGA